VLFSNSSEACYSFFLDRLQNSERQKTTFCLRPDGPVCNVDAKGLGMGLIQLHHLFAKVLIDN
jgi:hypothetical protein